MSLQVSLKQVHNVLIMPRLVPPAVVTTKPVSPRVSARRMSKESFVTSVKRVRSTSQKITHKDVSHASVLARVWSVESNNGPPLS